MASKTYTLLDNGMHGLPITVECHATNGLPGMVIVGLASKGVDEAKERLRSAFSSSGLNFPRKRLTLNLAPADEPKESSSLDLSMAISVLLSQTSQPQVRNNKTAYFGELGLDGTIRPVRGIIGKLVAAQEHGFRCVVIPEENAGQAALIDGLEILTAKNLRQVVNWLVDGTSLLITKPSQERQLRIQIEEDFSEIIGHTLAKRAIEIAAAGGHNILLNGPPGTGKSMLAKAIPGILPTLTKNQIIETTQIHSLVDRAFENVVTTPPFRSPHHTSSSVSIIGGGQQAKPGEISLAHNGVLFLDELPEYHRDCLEALRQPLEDHTVHIARAKQSVTYPAHFMLVATKNPCPCGHYGTKKTCVCSAYDIARYNKKLSGPIMDRIDIHCDVEEISYRLMSDAKHHEETSSSIRARVETARKIQQERNPEYRLNNQLTNKHFTTYDLASPDAKEFLTQAAERIGISARSYVRTLRVARTIADLDQKPLVEKQHIAEALQYRPREMQLV